MNITDILNGLAQTWATLGPKGEVGVIMAGVVTLAVAIIALVSYLKGKAIQFDADKANTGKDTGHDAQDGAQKDNDVNKAGDDFFGR